MMNAVICFRLAFIALMTVLNIGSLNINGCRGVAKRGDLFTYLQLKKVDVVLLQETHTDNANEAQWARDWNGGVYLSHGTNLSAGVAVLLSPKITCKPNIIEVVQGRILRVDLTLGDKPFSFFNVYAPNDGKERMLFFNQLADALAVCPQGNVVLVGGDHNCTENHVIDRNHDEPHPQSAEVLKSLVNRFNLVDLWRDASPGVRQYSWLRMSSTQVTAARLDRFYVGAEHRGLFYNSSISPTFLSDHQYISLSVSIQAKEHFFSHWHFNTKLLQDHSFIHAFTSFWESWREEKSRFSSLSQWWDVGKAQIKAFCLQYTAHSTRILKEKMLALEHEIANQTNNVIGAWTDARTDAVQRNMLLLKNLMEERGKGALVRARFCQFNDMDAPTAFFFGLEKKAQEQKRITHLKLPDGRDTLDQGEIRAHAVSYYEALYQAGSCEAEAMEALLQGLPQLADGQRQKLDGVLSYEEISKAASELNTGKAPGLDGLPAEFFQTMWNIIGTDLHSVFFECFSQGRLPVSCRRAVLTLLPKKGDLGYLKNWRPVSLLCADFKILSRALANRLKECMASLIHEDQSYCVPKRTIFDNLFLVRDIITTSRIHSIDLGLFSLDQEKAFDKVSHMYMLKTLKAFGFGEGFASYISLLYKDVYSMLKINGSLTRQFPVSRGIRQGCPLSGLLYSLAIEPLLGHLRKHLTGITAPGCPLSPPVKLTAYADDVTVVIRNDNDIAVLLSALDLFGRATSASVNWDKCTSLLLGDWADTPPPKLPKTCVWGKGGFKILGVFLGSDKYMAKNWEGLLDKVKGRLHKWRWVLPQLSYRGRVLVINNLAASMLWHKTTVLDPPSELIGSIQREFINFFWDGYHWLAPGVLHLPLSEGGQGLIHVESKVLALRLQTLQRLLYSPEGTPWVQFGLAVLRKAGGGLLDKHLVLMDCDWAQRRVQPHSSFYSSVFKALGLLSMSREGDVHFGAEEPLFYNKFLGAQQGFSPLLIDLFIGRGFSRVRDLLDLPNEGWKPVELLAQQLGFRSLRTMGRLLGSLKDSLPDGLRLSLGPGAARGVGTDTPVFPDFKISPKFTGVGVQVGSLLKWTDCTGLGFCTVGKRLLYHVCVKSTYGSQLIGRPDTKWRTFLGAGQSAAPSWRTLYKSPIPKRAGDLQWRILHCAMATKVFLARLGGGVSNLCTSCNVPDSVFHVFSECVKLSPLFCTLTRVCARFGFIFSKELFIFGVKYSKKAASVCTCLNFLVGQAKMAVWKCHRLEQEGKTVEQIDMFKMLVEARISAEFAYFQLTNNIDMFGKKWCMDKGLWIVDSSHKLRFIW